MDRRKLLVRFLWLFLSIFALAVGYGWKSGIWNHLLFSATSGPPTVTYPEIVDLGERASNENVVQKIEILNRGNEELIINQIRSTCSCSVLERAINGEYQPVEELHLSPGGREELVIRLSVRTAGAGTYKQVVSFQTNDPTHPEGRITLVYRTAGRGVAAVPNAIQFGRLSVGQEYRDTVDVIGADQAPLTVSSVTSSNPDSVAVKWVPAVNGEPRDTGIVLGKIEIVPNTGARRSFNANIIVAFEDPKYEPLVIPVEGRVASQVDVTPGSLVLPRTSSEGLLYDGRCLVRSYGSQPLRLEIASQSDGLKVELNDVSENTKLVRIRLDPSAKEPGNGLKQVSVRLRAAIGDTIEFVDIPVICESRK